MYSLYDTWGFPCEFPHSEISGSLAMCAYPKLIAAYHVLHRLLMPRHSPCALCSLTYCHYIISLKLSFTKNISWLVVFYKQLIYVQFSKNILRNFGLSKLNSKLKINLYRRNPLGFFIITSQTSCLLDFSIERRWSSRRFSYGYLVTTSPQSLTLP